MELEFVPYNPADALAIVPKSSDATMNQLLIETARLNAIAGPGYTALLDGRPVGCGGVRTHGIGDAWAVFSPEVLRHKVAFLRQSKEWLETMKRQYCIWKMWCQLETEVTWSILHSGSMTDAEKAEAKRMQENYVKFLGFEKHNECYVKG
jgi:hypothetical protein